MGFAWLATSLSTALVIGCGTGPTSPSGKPAIARAEPVPAAPVHAIHGASIAMVAVAAAGDAAVTADETGAFRLWPSFDGTHEPLVLHAQAPRALAIAHDGDGFAIAILDRAGLVEIQRVAGNGTLRSHTTLDGSAIAVTATPTGFVAIGEDRALAITDLAGGLRARLLPDPGSRIEAVIGTGDRLLAIASSASAGVRGRWIDLAHASWGATTPAIAGLEPTGAVLAPDATTLIGKGTEGSRTIRVMLATGKAEPLAGCEGGALIGFVDRDTLACFDGNQVAWWHGHQVGAGAPPVFGRVKSTAVATGTAATIAIGGGLVVAGNQTQLALATPMRAQYLGYEAAAAPLARFTAGGIVIGFGEGAHVMDRELASLPDLALPATANTWLDVVPLDARYTLTMATTPAHRKQIAIYDRETKQLGPEIERLGRDEELLAYEPTTGLVLGATATGRAVYAIDPVTRTIGAPHELKTPLAFLVDPALAGGTVVIAIDVSHGEGFDVAEYTLAGLATRDPARRYHVDGEFRAIDGAGRFYMAMSGIDPGDVVAFERGTHVDATFPGIAGELVRPRADGSSVAAASETVVTMFDREGRVRWAVPAIGARDLGWQGDVLIGQFATGFVRYDVATGAEVARKCGWGFGRYDTPRTSSTDEEEVVCD
jgi:hypothetical protein